MKLRVSLFVATLLLFATFMATQTGPVSSAPQPEMSESSMNMADNGGGISISGPLTLNQGDTATYVISYAGLEQTNGVKLEFTGIDFSEVAIVSMTPPASATYPDSYVWAFEDVGDSGSITVQLLHTNCGAIGHRASIIDTHPDPGSTEIVSASISTLVDCLPTPTPEPTATPTNPDFPPGCEPTIISIGSGDWTDSGNWDLGRVPNNSDVVWVQEEDQMTVEAPVHIGALCNEGTITSGEHHSTRIFASDYVTNYETGLLSAQDGDDETGSVCGRRGGSVIVRPRGGWGSGGVQITNLGTVQAGHGGDGECAGRGGSAILYGRNTNNSGTISAGNGGNLTGNVANRRAGRGGNTYVWGKYGGSGYLISTNGISAGHGGHANSAATNAQRGGHGGTLKLISLPFVYLFGGPYSAGIGGDGVNGGADGRWGRLIIEPDGEIVFDGANVSGGNVEIFGADNWVLDLNGANNRSGGGTTISATEGITLAVGTDGIIDLRGNADTVLNADESVSIFTDNLLLDGDLDDIIDAPEIMTDTAQLLRGVSVGVPESIGGERNSVQIFTISILNDGPEEDTFNIEITDTAGWGIGSYPASLTVPGLEAVEFDLVVTIPANDDPGTIDTITTTAVSADGEVSASEQTEIIVEFPPTAITLTNAEASTGSNWQLSSLLLLMAGGFVLAGWRLMAKRSK